MDIIRQRINLLKLENLREYVPLSMPMAPPGASLGSRAQTPPLRGVVALTNVNETNLKIAIAAKLMHKEVKVICRADSREVEANMDSFGTNHIVDPFDTFATHLATALQAPSLYLLYQWLTGLMHESLPEPLYPPKDGHWVLCGYGRFGKAIYERLQDEGLETVIVEAKPGLDRRSRRHRSGPGHRG